MTTKHTLSLTAYLQSTKPPWTALLKVKTGQAPETLVQTPDGYALTVIKGRHCKTPANLFAEFARAMKFPDYFGHNWDALEECLADLEWLPAKGYVLLITDAVSVLPNDDTEYENLLEILSDAGETWGNGQAETSARRGTPFHALFAVSERDRSARAHWGMKEIDTEPPRKPRIQRRASSNRP